MAEDIKPTPPANNLPDLSPHSPLPDFDALLYSNNQPAKLHAFLVHICKYRVSLSETQAVAQAMRNWATKRLRPIKMPPSTSPSLVIKLRLPPVFLKAYTSSAGPGHRAPESRKAKFDARKSITMTAAAEAKSDEKKIEKPVDSQMNRMIPSITAAEAERLATDTQVDEDDGGQGTGHPLTGIQSSLASEVQNDTTFYHTALDGTVLRIIRPGIKSRSKASAAVKKELRQVDYRFFSEPRQDAIRAVFKSKTLPKDYHSIMHDNIARMQLRNEIAAAFIRQYSFRKDPANYQPDSSDEEYDTLHLAGVRAPRTGTSTQEDTFGSPFCLTTHSGGGSYAPAAAGHARADAQCDFSTAATHTRKDLSPQEDFESSRKRVRFA